MTLEVLQTCLGMLYGSPACLGCWYPLWGSFSGHPPEETCGVQGIALNRETAHRVGDQPQQLGSCPAAPHPYPTVLPVPLAPTGSEISESRVLEKGDWLPRPRLDPNFGVSGSFYNHSHMALHVT